MAKNVVQKILESHLRDGVIGETAEIGIHIDQTLTQDATGTMAYLQFEAMGIKRVKTDLSVSYVDHNTLQTSFENADDHHYLQTVAAKYGIVYSRAGNGICHQVHLERFGKPGQTLLGSDSHTPTGGGIGMIAIGAGGLDVAVAMAGGLFYIPSPKVILVKLSGVLSSFVTAKDVILKLLLMLSTKGNVGKIIEYGGPGVATLSVPERATITNMGAELGITTSVFPSDAVTRDFLKAQGRETDWIECIADFDADYDRLIEIDLSSVEPMVAQPHSPDQIVLLRDIKNLLVNQVMIGSCTNGSYADLAVVATLLKGKTIHPTVSVGVAPGSKQVLEMLARDGYLADLIASGVRILESACGFCIGNGQAPGDKGVSLRTNNRNFKARSGTENAEVYLASPEVCAAAALAGKVVDPRDYFKDVSVPVNLPVSFLVNDNLLIFPLAEESSVSIYRGPNIGQAPCGEALKSSILGRVAIKVSDKITTDHIMPAGPFLKYRSNIPIYATYVFHYLDARFAERCLDNQEQHFSSIIIAGESYGQGSSREHAAMCPMFLGVRAVIAKSMERIHKANLINFGIIPFQFAYPDDYAKFSIGDELEIPFIQQRLAANKPIVCLNQTKGEEYTLHCELTSRQREIVLAGGVLTMIKAKESLTRSF